MPNDHILEYFPEDLLGSRFIVIVWQEVYVDVAVWLVTQRHRRPFKLEGDGGRPASLLQHYGPVVITLQSVGILITVHKFCMVIYGC